MKKWVLISIVITVALTSPWWLMAGYIGVGMIYGEIDEYRYAPTSEFDSDRWKKGRSRYRFSVLDAVAENIIENGMSEGEVTELLGQPDYKDDKGSFQYESLRPGWRLIDFSGGGIRVEYDEHRNVNRITKNTWID